MHSAPVLHPILAYNPAPWIHFNITRPARELAVRPSYTNFNAATLEESAFQTPIPYVTLFIPHVLLKRQGWDKYPARVSTRFSF